MLPEITKYNTIQTVLMFLTDYEFYNCACIVNLKKKLLLKIPTHFLIRKSIEQKLNIMKKKIVYR